jgi:hypothetical protein
MYNTDMPRRAELPSQAQLLRSTAIAIVTAGVLLTTVVLPSEYGIDPTGIGSVLRLTEMGKIKSQLAADAAADAAAAERKAASGPLPPPRRACRQRRAVADASRVRSDEMQVTLQPGEGTEVKMAMLKGRHRALRVEDRRRPGQSRYPRRSRQRSGQHLPQLQEGKHVSGSSGEFAAVFDGKHGWFWRNRSDKPVTITLKTSGVYSSIKKMM